MVIELPWPNLPEFMSWPIRTAFAGINTLISLALIVFWIWMLVDCAQRKFKNNTEKIIWIIVIALTQWLGALIYLIVINLNNPKGISK